MRGWSPKRRRGAVLSLLSLAAAVAVAVAWGPLEGRATPPSQFPGGGATGGDFPGGTPPFLNPVGPPPDPCAGDPDVASCQAVFDNCQASCLAKGTPFFGLTRDFVLEDENWCEPQTKVALQSCTVRVGNILCLDVICACLFCEE